MDYKIASQMKKILQDVKCFAKAETMVDLFRWKKMKKMRTSQTAVFGVTNVV